MTCIKFVAALAALAAALAASAAPAPATESDLPAAREAFQKANVKALESWRERFAGHPLEAYPAYWLLAARIDKADPAEVRAFLARHADSPLAETLRRDWLRALGAAADWEAFRPEYPKVLADDPELVCYAFQERLARQDAGVLPEVKALFVAGEEAPESCEAPFAALVASGAAGPAQTWERLRKLLAAGRLKDAKRANHLLPRAQAFNDRTLDRAAADPAAFLGREKSPILARAARELVLFAVGRLARTRPDEAAERLDLVAGRLGPDDARFAWGQVAFHAAMAHHPRALAWYALAGDTGLTNAQAAWKARAGLRAGDWKAVFAAIRALPPEEAREGAWRYWRSRALRALGSPEAADLLLRSLAPERSFYGLLAAEDLGAAVPPDWNGWRPAESDLERVRLRPGIARALALYRVGLDPEAFREWTWSIRGLDDRELLAAAEVARIAGVPDRAINTAERTVQVHDFAQRYPTPHREALAAASRQWNLDEALLYGIIRQESRFMPEARSRAGATGLMQLMPTTARWVARNLPVAGYRPAMLTQPETNVQMGSYYFRRVLSELGDPVLATAAYNAGPGRARRWRDAAPLEGAIYAETIPFSETRDYVKKVVANAWFYTHRLTGKPASIRQLLGTVPGRAGASDALASTLP